MKNNDYQNCFFQNNFFQKTKKLSLNAEQRLSSCRTMIIKIAFFRKFFIKLAFFRIIFDLKQERSLKTNKFSNIFLKIEIEVLQKFQNCFAQYCKSLLEHFLLNYCKSSFNCDLKIGCCSRHLKNLNYIVLSFSLISYILLTKNSNKQKIFKQSTSSNCPKLTEFLANFSYVFEYWIVSWWHTFRSCGLSGMWCFPIKNIENYILSI